MHLKWQLNKKKGQRRKGLLGRGVLFEDYKLSEAPELGTGDDLKCRLCWL